jgi:hypothetical protein
MQKSLVIFAFIFLVLTASCGFEVVYRDDLKQNNSQLNQSNHYSFYQSELSAIKIKKTRDKIDQQLKNNLYDVKILYPTLTALVIGFLALTKIIFGYVLLVMLILRIMNTVKMD